MILRYDRSLTSLEKDGKKITMVSLMIPMLMQQIFTQFYGTANTILLSGFLDTAVSASSVANQIFDISIVILTMVSTGTVILSSIEIGAGNRDKAARYAGTGALTILFVSFALAVINLVFAKQLLGLVNLKGDTLSLAYDYLRMRALFLPAIGLMNFFNQLLICNGYSKYTLAVGVFSNLINLGLSYVALYSGISFASPIERVAISAGVAQIFGLAMAIFFFKLRDCPFAFTYRVKNMAKIVKLGVPGAMVSLMFRIAQTVTTGFVALMGDDVINTKVYINNIVAYIPLVGYSISSANMVFMGRFKGAGELEKSDRLFRQNRAIAFSCNLVLSLVVLIFHRPLMSLFTSNTELIDAAGKIFFIDLFVQLPRAINNISESSLSANGDVRITFITSTLSCWLGSVALSYLLCVILGWGLVGLWTAFAADETFKSIVYIFRWRSGKWRNIDI